MSASRFQVTELTVVAFVTLRLSPLGGRSCFSNPIS